MGHRFSGRLAWLAVPVLWLATPWLFYSVVFWGHTVVASVLIWGHWRCCNRASAFRTG